MKVPSGKFIKKYGAKERDFKIITDELVQQHFYGYLETSGVVEGVPAKGYLVFEDGIPVVAYYEHTDSLNCKYAIKSIYDDVVSGDADVSIYELTQSMIDVFKRYISCVNKPGKDIVAIDIHRWNKDGKLCPKWGSVPKESSCNVCKEQCTLSVADPDHFIAKKFIKNFEIVRQNRMRVEKSDTKGEESVESVNAVESLEKSAKESLIDAAKNVGAKGTESASGLKSIKEIMADRKLGSEPASGLKPIKEIIEDKELESEPAVAAISDEDAEKNEFEESMKETEAYMRESVTQFRDQSRGILESLGLGHLIDKNDDNADV